MAVVVADSVATVVTAMAVVVVALVVVVVSLRMMFRVANSSTSAFSEETLRTDGPTDLRTYGRPDRPSYRDARTHLKR